MKTLNKNEIKIICGGTTESDHTSQTEAQKTVRYVIGALTVTTLLFVFTGYTLCCATAVIVVTHKGIKKLCKRKK